MIASCGEALVDLVPDPTPGGGPMNVAVAAARLGGRAAFVGRVSTDDLGDMIWRHLETNGVDLRAAERGPEPTARATVEHVPHLVFRFEGDGTADTMLRSVDLGVLGPVSPIVHGGTLGLFRGLTARTLAALVEQHQGLVSLDPNVRPQIIDNKAQWEHFHDRWLRCCDIYKASVEDLAWIWPGRETESVAAELLSGRPAVVAVTHGADGATLYTAGGVVPVSGVEVDVVDTVGAGDTFIASMLVSLTDRAEGRHRPLGSMMHELGTSDWRAVALRAVMAAGITCSRRGADPPTRAELDRRLAR